MNGVDKFFLRFQRARKPMPIPNYSQVVRSWQDPHVLAPVPGLLFRDDFNDTDGVYLGNHTNYAVNRIGASWSVSPTYQNYVINSNNVDAIVFAGASVALIDGKRVDVCQVNSSVGSFDNWQGRAGVLLRASPDFSSGLVLYCDNVFDGLHYTMRVWLAHWDNLIIKSGVKVGEYVDYPQDSISNLILASRGGGYVFAQCIPSALLTPCSLYVSDSFNLGATMAGMWFQGVSYPIHTFQGFSFYGG